MNNEDKYWEDLIADLHEEGKDIRTKPSFDENKEYDSDYAWATETKSSLRKVFLWDLFDKKEARSRLYFRLEKNHQSVLLFSRKMWVRAAVILIAVISGALLHALLPGLLKEKETLYSEVVVPMGQMSQINLSDGSKIWLNSGSVFKYPTDFGRTSREVFIDGEAFMEVAKDKHKPFIVNAKRFSVKVLGTSFNVSAYSGDESANVTLIEGAVLLQGIDNKWSRKLIPGESAELQDSGTTQVTKVNTDFYTSWKDGRIVFRNETLEEIAKKMERWYNVEIRFKDEELKKNVFSGTFLKYKPVEQVLKSLSIMDGHIDFVSESRTAQKDIIYIIKRDDKKNNMGR